MLKFLKFDQLDDKQRDALRKSSERQMQKLRAVIKAVDAGLAKLSGRRGAKHR